MPKPVRILLCLIGLPILAVMILLLNIIQMLSLLVLPISGRIFRTINRLAATFWFNSLVFFLEKIILVRLVVTGSPLPQRENAFVVSNHQTMSDIPVLVILSSRCERSGDLKWFVKDVIKWIPGIGWGMLFLDCLYVKRNWSADKDKIAATFDRLRKHKVPFWVLSFVEGTRLTPSKLRRAQGYEEKTGLPLMRNVMSPRTKGFEATLEGLSGLTEAVYDMTIAYEDSPVGLAPGLKTLFFGPLKQIHVHVQRFPIQDVPKDREERVQWILDRFKEKDERLAGFRRNGKLA